MAWWIFQNVVVTAALAVVVATVCKTSRIGPVGRHALWLLVLVKFVTPPLVVWPWAAPDPLGVAMLDVRVDERSMADARVVPQESLAPQEAAAATSPNSVQEFASRDSRDRSIARVGKAAWPWLSGLWLTGSLCLLGIQGVRLARLARRVRTGRPADPAIANRVAALSRHLGLRPVPVLTVTGNASPLVWCLGQPRLLWPEKLPADSTAACVDGLLVHELAHVKRRDHLVGWIELVAGVVWWWNPLFWFVRSALREQAELACDAWVISALPDGRRAYAESLLALSGAAVRGTPSMAVVAIRASSRRVLERRLVMIMQGRAPLRLSLAGLLTLALMAAASLPAWATGSQQLPPPPPQPAQVAKPATPPLPPPKPRAPAEARAVRDVIVRTAVPSPGRSAARAQAPIRSGTLTYNFVRRELPEDGQKLVQGFETDREAIQKEADQKVEARRETLVKAMQALQDQYAKEGKLDEAIAIRDYIRAGLPGFHGKYLFRYVPR